MVSLDLANEVELLLGGFVPMLDGRVRVDIPFDNYVFYKRLLEKMIGVSW